MKHSRPTILAAILVLVALNLRGAMTALGPVLPDIMHDTDLSAGAAGLLTTMPVLFLGALAPLAAIIAQRIGVERTLLLLMVILSAGCLVRGQGGVAALLGSGVLIGGAIGMTNVLLPGLVKRDFPRRVALMTGLYTMALCVSAAIGTALSVPIARLLDGWPASLAVWALPALLAAFALLPLARDGARAAAARTRPVRGLWRDKLAWRLSIFFGTQSAFTYILFAWLPPLLRDRGMDPVLAGFASSVSSLTQMVASLAAPLIAMRARDQRAAAPIALAVALAGMLGCLYLPIGWVWASSAVMGAGQGSVFAVALMLVVLRAADADVAAHLSGMAQTVAYLMAAAGPILVGLLHDAVGGWWIMAPVMSVITLVGMITGGQAGTPHLIGGPGRGVTRAGGD